MNQAVYIGPTWAPQEEIRERPRGTDLRTAGDAKQRRCLDWEDGSW